MNNIYTEINKKTGGKFKDIRFPKVVFNGKTACVTVLCRDADRAFVAVNRTELDGLIREVCAFHTPVEIKVESEPPTAQSLRDAVVSFTEKFSYISSILHTITADTEPCLTVSLKMHASMRELAESDYFPRLREFLSDNFIDDVKLDVVETVLKSAGAGAYTGKSEYGITNIEPLYGSLAPEKAQSVSTITANGYNVVVCGLFAMPTAFVSKGGKKYEKFLLFDGELSVQCRWNADGGKSIVKEEYIGRTACVLGNVEYDAARGEASIAVREICFCTADGLVAPKYKKEPAKYTRIFPEEYYEYVQSSMFDDRADLPASLNGDFVVFDFETTGLSVLTDRPTELGAVKIQNGTITQSFHTMIDPRRDIPADVTEKTGITNDMVKGQPLFEDILPDFYKFTYGCGLVGHNISFDFPFLIKGGNNCGYAFGNRRTYDTMGLAPAALPGIQRVSLDKVLEGLGLTNDNAHRALSDAAATAKAFIELNKRLA